MSKFFSQSIQQQLYACLINNCVFCPIPQLICSRKNKTHEVKQKISDYLEGKETLVFFLVMFTKGQSQEPFSIPEAACLNGISLLHYSLDLNVNINV